MKTKYESSPNAWKKLTWTYRKTNQWLVINQKPVTVNQKL